jgi:hypothetical protein
VWVSVLWLLQVYPISIHDQYKDHQET